MTDPIQLSVEYLQRRGYKIPLDVLSLLHGEADLTTENKAEIAEAIRAGTAHSRAMKALSYQAVRDDLWAAVYDNVYGFLSSKSQVGTYSRPMSVAVANAYLQAADIGYQDGGASLPLDPDTAAYVKGELDAQFGYIDSLFVNLKQLRNEEDLNAIHEAFMRADGYCNSLDALYNYVKAAAAGNRMLTWGGNDGKESCKDCRRLKGQRHRASWWVSHGLVPPTRNTECGGWRCEHRLYDDKGNEFTV